MQYAKDTQGFKPSVAARAGFWPDPKTHIGWAAKAIDERAVAKSAHRRYSTKVLAMRHRFTNFIISRTNAFRRFWLIFPPVIVLSAGFLWKLYYRTRRKDTHYVWYRRIFLVGTFGTLGHLALAPVTGNLFVNVFSFAIYPLGLFTIGLSLLNTGNPHADDPKREVQYGPAFREPGVNGSGTIHIAAYDRAVLPEASRWAAKGGDWPIEIPVKKLSSGITILGEKGTGKSRLMFTIHDEIRAKYPNIPFLIHDPKGEWYRTYFDPKTDVLFGPNVAGSSRWDIWGDLKQYPEMVHGVLNTAVYAHQTAGDTFWSDNAVRLLENAFSNPTLESARDYLIAKKEANMDDKMFLSVYGTSKLALRDIVNVALMPSPKDGTPTPSSINDYLTWPGRIILLNNPAFAAEQRGAFSLFLSAFLLRALSLPDVPAGELRLVAFVDEALTFRLPPEVEKLIYTQCRSKGIVIIAGAQRLPDTTLHEHGEWATAEYMFALKVLHLQSQDQLSKRAGAIAYDEKTTSKQRDRTSATKGISEGTHAKTHAAIPPETFGRFKTREGVLFHDEGVAPFRTNLIDREQRDINPPGYFARADVIEFMKKLD